MHKISISLAQTHLENKVFNIGFVHTISDWYLVVISLRNTREFPPLVIPPASILVFVVGVFRVVVVMSIDVMSICSDEVRSMRRESSHRSSRYRA